jgi:hypothetical protein
MQLNPSILSRSLLFLGALASVLALSSDSAAGTKPSEARKPVITKPKFDPSAEKVEFFEGMDDGQLETRFVPKDANGGFLLVTNTTGEPVTVEFPEAFVAVQVLKQFGMMGGGGGLGGGGGGLGGGQQGGGQNQNAGGGLGGGQGGLGGGGLGAGGGGQQGGGFFSIPPERTVRVPYVSACLNHGKPDPSARLEYKLVPVEEYTKDEVLAELIRMVGTGRGNQHSAQAAIWTRTDNMSWQQLAAKNVRGILSVQYYFNAQNIQEGQMMMAAAEGIVREKSKETEKSESNEAGSPRVR